MAGSRIDPGSLTGSAARALAYRLFSQALEYQGELREQFLERECRGDSAFRAEIDALLRLAQHDETATRAFLALPRRQEEDLVGRIFGHFRLVELIGQGGMGVVYRAERNDGVQQSVALKVVSMDLAGVSQSRFEREAQMLAALEHPAVARLIDAGVEEGRAWLAMEFVRGERIDQYCLQKHLAPRDIVALLVQLADAVSVAHRMLVVHSDIKPANVLVTAEGIPKLIDFGIATALRDAATSPEASLNTGRLFSPGFAAPEQITGGAITVATDVYGLGALAYLLFTGAPPFPDAHDPLAYMRAISESRVEMASRALLVASADLGKAGALRGDLDAILAKALERDPALRYATASELRADLKRFLERRPVLARGASPAYRAGKFVQRHALAVSLSGLLVAPTSIILGQSATLTWSSTNATACTASNAWTGTEAVSGTQSVTPTAAGSLSYVLTCTGAGGSANGTAMLMITNPLPTVTITVAPTSITVGQSATLTWSSTNSTACTASNAWTGTETVTGTQSVTPTAAGSLSYVLTCTGAGGSANATAALTVAAAAPTVTIAVAPTSITVGQSATLTWSSSNATSCTASGSWSGTQASSGTMSVSPTTAGAANYVLACTGAGGTANGTAALTVNAVPSKSGGGSIGAWDLLGLALLGLAASRRRLRVL